MKLLDIPYTGLRKVISGGQTGSDFGGLLVAKDFHLETGGTAPMGWKTSKGNNPALGSEFGLVESTSPLYNIRTKANIVNSDATLIVASNFQSPGTMFTGRFCASNKKPFFNLRLELESRFTGQELYDEQNYPWVFVDFLSENNVSVLNVAGNRDRNGTYHQDRTAHFLKLVFEALKHEDKLITIT